MSDIRIYMKGAIPHCMGEPDMCIPNATVDQFYDVASEWGKSLRTGGLLTMDIPVGNNGYSLVAVPASEVGYITLYQPDIDVEKVFKKVMGLDESDSDDDDCDGAFDIENGLTEETIG